jgi:hypothetical protein
MTDERPEIAPPQHRHESSQLDALREAGFDADFEVREEGLVLRGQGLVDPREIHIDLQYRFEGASDPDDESVVFGLHDPSTGTRGVLISAYGPAASADEADVLAVLAANPSCSASSSSAS